MDDATKKKTQKPPFELRVVTFMLKSKTFYVTFSAIFVAFILSVYAYAVYKTDADLDPRNTSMVKFVDHVANLILMASNIISVCYWGRFRKLYELVSEALADEYCFLVTITKCEFLRLLRYYNLFIVLILVADVYFIVENFGWGEFHLIISRDVQFYTYNFVSIVMLIIASYIINRFRSSNRSFAALGSKFFDSGTIDVGTVAENDRWRTFAAEIRATVQFRNQSCSLAEKFNDMYGIILLSCVIYVITAIVWSINIIIGFNMAGNELGNWILGTYIVRIINATSQAVILAYIGDALIQEEKRSVNCCCDFLNKLTTGQPFEEVIRRELNAFIDQIATRPAFFSAGGFFKIDYGILSIVASNVVTYSIVLIQFSMQNLNSSAAKNGAKS
ncbi:uncharacterized protein LOC132705488 [Cylas formicarius]|uniref:uncharacterized protein LOC132705488 n=1 Tax=Cylas formicarius TaxID=197179 RepID=UPI0029588614|nr:uncharacterized protein LOC132705488 [Cylas formicarius]